MANLITHKRSSVASAVPAPSQLALGEIAINTTDKLLFIKDGSNNVVALNNTDNVVEGTNLYYTDARARSALSVIDNAGDGSLSYDDVTGVFTYSGISDAQVRSKLSAAGDLSYNPATGEFTVDVPDAATARTWFSAAGDLSYNSSTGEFSFTERTDSQIRSLFTGSGDLAYNSATGEFTYNEPTPAELLTAIKTVDGATSGLDADLLDGSDGAYYLDYANFTNTPTVNWQWSVQTGAYTASANDAVAADGTFTVNLPASPVQGDMVLVANVGAGTITVSGNGNTINFTGTLAATETVTATFINATYGWIKTN